VLEGIAGFLYRRADHIVAVTSAFEKCLVHHWQVPAEKISLVENGVETELFHTQVATGDLRQELGVEGKTLISYIGTIGMAHGLESLLQAALLLRQQQANITLLVLGEGAEKESIRQRARELSLNNILFVDQQPHEVIPAYICASDACLVLLKKTDVFRTVLPTKMLECMACGRPVILGVDGQAREILAEAGAGMYVEPENPRQLADAMICLASNSALREQFGRQGRRFIVQKMSREQTAKRYLQVLHGLIQSRAGHADAFELRAPHQDRAATAARRW
jgi:glycosyltransferase involved in cell wall biosynthesis